MVPEVDLDTFAVARTDGAPVIDVCEPYERVPDGEVWVHCRSGYRAFAAASILGAAGRTVVAIDGEYDHAARAGLLLVSGKTKVVAA